jgi:hypothetical protein
MESVTLLQDKLWRLSFIEEQRRQEEACNEKHE